MCTASSSVTERVRGLQMGVDDWLTKPCHTEELVARIEAVVGHRRRPEQRRYETVSVGEVEIRGDRYQAYVGGRSLGLTRREFELIELLAGAGDEAVEREVIYEQLWGYPMLRCDRSVDVFVHKLRRKLALASPGWAYIHTHWGLGYRLAAHPVEGSEAVLDVRLRAAAGAPGGLAQAARAPPRAGAARGARGGECDRASRPACPRPRRGRPPGARARRPAARRERPNR